MLALRAAELKCGAEAGEPPIYMRPARQRGGEDSHCAGPLTPEEEVEEGRTKRRRES